MKMTKFIPVIVLFSFASGLFGGVFAVKLMLNGTELTSSEGKKVISSIEETYIEESQIIEAIEIAAPAVVSITASKDVEVRRSVGSIFDNPFFFDFGSDPFSIPGIRGNGSEIETEYKEVSGGTGFIVGEGMILTNKHVVQDEGADYSVALQDGSEYKVEVVSRDPFEDVAVLKFVEEVEGLPSIEFGDSSALKVGQKVVAIGNALAEYENTVTSGIISATGRDISAFNDARGAVDNLSGLLQTDAAINPGNSGGPLINLQGEVVGMNVAVAKTANGIGFAIPVDDLKPILKSVEEHGEIVRPVIGVRFLMLSEKEAEQYGVEVKRGALLIGNDLDGSPAILPGGAADEAGLKSLDVILEVNGDELSIDNPLQRVVRSYMPGDKLNLKVWRDGRELEIGLELGSTADLEV